MSESIEVTTTDENLPTQETEQEEETTEVEETEAVSTKEESEEETEEEETPGEEAIQEENKGQQSGVKKRIARLAKKLDRKDEEIDYWKAKARKLEMSKEAEDKPEQESQDNRPRSEDYENEEDFIEALVDWKADEKLSKLQESNRQKSQQDSQKALAENWNKKVSEFVETTPDFDDVLDEVEDIPVPVNLQKAVFESEHGPAVMYELAKNPEKIGEFEGLSEYQTGVKIGKIEAALVKTETTPTRKRKTTKAPPPISTIRGTAKVTKDPSKMTQKEYEAYRRGA